MKKTLILFLLSLILLTSFLIVQGESLFEQSLHVESTHPWGVYNKLASIANRIEKEIRPSEMVDSDVSIQPYQPGSKPYHRDEDLNEYHISIFSVGDIMAHTIQFEAAKTEDGYNFDPQFEYMTDKIQSKDFAIANLETVFAGEERRYSGANMIFNAPDALGVAIKNAGFDLITTANNHSLDRGFEGIKRTIEVLDSLKLAHTGTYTNEADSQEILIFEKDSVTFALLSYSYSTNGWPIPTDHPYAINMMEEDKIIADIHKAKSQGVDMVLVAVHWGIEYQLEPNRHQVDLANKMFYAGADIILGTHPHVLEPFEHKKMVDISGDEKDKFIIYSQGNFVSGQRTYPRAIGMYINFDVVRKGESIYVNTVSVMPTYVENTFVNGKRYMRVLDTHASQILDPENDFMTTSLIRLLKEYEMFFTKHLASRVNMEPYLNDQNEYVIYEK